MCMNMYAINLSCVCGSIHTSTQHRLRECKAYQDEHAALEIRLPWDVSLVPRIRLSASLFGDLPQRPAGHLVWLKITSSREGHGASIPWARRPWGSLWSDNTLPSKYCREQPLSVFEWAESPPFSGQREIQSTSGNLCPAVFGAVSKASKPAYRTVESHRTWDK